MRFSLQRPLLSIMVAALLLTVGVTLVSIVLANAYYENYSFFFDPVSYYIQNVKLYQLTQDYGRWLVVKTELLRNSLNPLRTLPVLLFAPNYLLTPNAHLLTAVPVLFAYLSLLGWTVFRRTGSIVYASSCMFLFCALPGMYSLHYGFHVYWLDLHAALLVGSALCCLLNSSGARNLWWLSGFAVFVAFSALARSVAIAFAFVVCSPILLMYLIQRWLKERDVLRAVVRPLGLIVLILVILCGYYLLVGFEGNRSYYGDYGYAYRLGVSTATLTQIRILGGFVYWGAVPLLLLFIANLQFFWGLDNWDDKFALLWSALSVTLFLSAVLQARGSLPSLYALPGLFLAAVSLGKWRYSMLQLRYRPLLITAVALLGLLIGGSAILRSFWFTYHPSSEAQAKKILDIELARAVSDQGDRIVWGAYFSEYDRIPSMEATYRFGKFPMPAGIEFFSVHKTYWQANYPGRSAAEIADIVYTRTSESVDVAVVFADPGKAESYFDNDYSRVVAQYVARRLRSDPQWKQVFSVQSSYYGQLDGYRNLANTGDSYDRVLKKIRDTTLAWGSR